MQTTLIISLVFNVLIIYALSSSIKGMRRSVKLEIEMILHKRLIEDLLDLYLKENGEESYKRFRNLLINRLEDRKNGRIKEGDRKHEYGL